MLTDDAILGTLKAFAAESLELPAEDVARVSRDLPVVEGLRLDSLRQVMLLTRIEEEYGFEFDPDELTLLGPEATVGDLVALIQRRATGAPAN
jgi:acyl carrier protein